MKPDLKPLIMGIVNVTPDSFADGGRHYDRQKAIARAKVMIAEGADILDIGGESTRPGAERISVDEERERTIQVITELQPLGVPISIDTTRAEIARNAIAAGATIVNDVSGGLGDRDMSAVIRAHPTVQYVVMHWRGESADMQSRAVYADVVKEVKEELDDRVTALLSEGVLPEQIILDPGIGFAKTAKHNWELLRNLERLQLLGYPVLVGASRKSFLGELVGAPAPDDREFASIALTAQLPTAGVWGVRTHSVKPHVDAIKVAMELLA